MLRTREQLQEALDDNPVPISGSPKRARSSLAGAWTGTSPASRSTSPEHPLRGLNSRTNTSGGARHLQPRGHGSLVRHAGRVSGQTLVDDLLAAATDRRFHGLATKQFQQPQLLVVKAVEHLVTIVELQLGLPALRDGRRRRRALRRRSGGTALPRRNQSGGRRFGSGAELELTQASWPSRRQQQRSIRSARTATTESGQKAG